MFCALLTSRYQVSVYRTNGPLVPFLWLSCHKTVILNPVQYLNKYWLGPLQVTLSSFPMLLFFRHIDTGKQ